MNRKEALAKIWRETHSDFKGKINGVKSIMILRKGGSVLCPLDGLTDPEILTRVPEYKA